MSMNLDKIKKYDKQKKKNLNLKKNFINTQEKSNLNVKSVYMKSPRQKSFIVNKKRNQKSNDIYYTKNSGNDNDDMNDMNGLLSGENDPFSRSVVYSNNKKIANSLFPIRNKKSKDMSSEKNPKLQLLNKKASNKINIGANHSVKNSNIKTNKHNMYKKLNISGDFSGLTKFDEKFQLIEDKIIDKNYENDIDHDEMIIGTNKKHTNKSNINSLFNKIKIDINDDNDDLYTFFNKKNEYDNEEEYLINNNFENNKNDFFIMYIDNYETMIDDDMLLLEIQLLYEKILDLQNSYHEEYMKMIKQINNDKQFISLIIYKYKEIYKKKFTLLKIKEKNNCKNELNSFINIQEKEKNSYFSEINNREINLWTKMLGNNIKKRELNSNKIKILKVLFKKIVFDKYYSLKNTINDIENKIIINLMKKYNYKMLSDKKKKHSYINGNYNSTNFKKDKILPKTKINNHKNINSNDVYQYRNNKKNIYKNNKYNIYNNYISTSRKKVIK